MRFSIKILVPLWMLAVFTLAAPIPQTRHQVPTSENSVTIPLASPLPQEEIINPVLEEDTTPIISPLPSLHYRDFSLADFSINATVNYTANNITLGLKLFDPMFSPYLPELCGVNVTAVSFPFNSSTSCELEDFQLDYIVYGLDEGIAVNYTSSNMPTTPFFLAKDECHTCSDLEVTCDMTCTYKIGTGPTLPFESEAA
ncbi:hypothetical protein B0J14DRAFT_648474 [Halenospora varia]|nr:hypothetical protein B0J14DRAFT_648474 [Halenospora varia]